MTKDQQENFMPALVFEMKLGKLIKGFFRGKRKTSGYWKEGGPVSIKQVPIPSLVDDDWVLVRTVYCGICGSDMKELTLSGASDNPLRSFITFPQTMGHEPVGIIEKIGANVSKLKVGDRVAISPWFPCKARSIFPECPRCQQGDYTHCKNFQRGDLPIGMHLGVTRGFGGFAPYISVHESQCFIIPENVSFEHGVLADPFSVAFHSILILEPEINSTILVYGLGVIGLLTIMCLKKIFKVEHVLAVGRYNFQKEMALNLGADYIFMKSGKTLIEEIAEYMNVELFTPDKGLKWCIDGVDGILDTIASAETLEVGMRILKAQGRLVFSGVSTPKRCESTVHYFKEIEIIGSNAFSIEKFNNRKAHAFEFLMQFLKENLIDTSIFVSHKVSLPNYRKAFDLLTNKKDSKACKIIFDFSEKTIINNNNSS